MAQGGDVGPSEIMAVGEEDAVQPVSAAPAGKLVGRAAAARLLGVSKSTLRRMEGDRLTPVVGPKNVRLFREEEIQSMTVTRRSVLGLAPRATGEVAADVFELFDQSVHAVDVVKRLRLEPDLVEGLHQRWCKMRGLLVLSDASARALHRMLHDNPSEPRPANEAELLALAEKWVRDESLRRCEQCRNESAAFCRTCARAWGLRAARNHALVERTRKL